MPKCVNNVKLLHNCVRPTTAEFVNFVWKPIKQQASKNFN